MSAAGSGTNRRSRSSLVLTAIAVLMVATYLLCSVRSGPPERPLGSAADFRSMAARDDLNVLFIVIDTLRADRLGAYGYERDTTPTLDQLAKTGVRFANHLSQSSWTKCSMASLWTGLYPNRTKVLRYSDALSPEARMPAELLREKGYWTAAIWRNGWVAPVFGFDQGFEDYHNPAPARVPPSIRRKNPAIKIGGTDLDVLDSALEFLRNYTDMRWFLYLHLMDVHQYVYDEESALFGTTYSDFYDNAVRHSDSLLRVLVDTLTNLGLRNKTLIVVVADHGEAFGEHGSEGHARNLYAEVSRTPWIISPPFRLEPGLVVEEPTANVDVWSTLAEILGLEMGETDGKSRLTAIEGANRGTADPNPVSPAARFGQLDQTWGRPEAPPNPLVSVTSGPYRFFYHVNNPEDRELYDVRSDPTERNNIASDHPEVVRDLDALAEAYLAHGAPPWGAPTPQVKLDDFNLQQLRALGYVIE